MAGKRLFELLYYLLEHRQTTAKQLAEVFEVSLRTIYRDLQQLILAGVPIINKPGYEGGVYLDENFVMDRTLLNHQEQLEILTSLQALDMLKDQDNQLSKKISSLFNLSDYDWIAVDFNSWHHKNDLNARFEHLKYAIINNLQVSFNYLDLKGNDSWRQVYPLKLIFKAATWYLQAYCLKRQKLRVFRLSRIQNLKIDAKTFDKEVIIIDENNNDYGLKESMIDIVLYFDSSIASVAYDGFESAAISKDNMGNVIVKAKVADGTWLLSFILSFGSKIKVLAPKSLQKQILLEYEKINNLYRGT